MNKKLIAIALAFLTTVLFFDCTLKPINSSFSKELPREYQDSIAQTLSTLDSLPPVVKLNTLTSTLKFLEGYHAHSLELDVIYELGRYYYQIQDSISFNSTNIVYLAKAQERSDTTHMAQASFNRGITHLDKSEYDHAYFYFNQARVFYKSKHDSLGQVRSLLNMSIIETTIGEYYDSAATAHVALNYLDPKNIELSIGVYNNLGLISTELKRFPEALEWFKRSFSLTNLPHYQKIILNNLGLVTQEMGDYDAALSYFYRVNTISSPRCFPKIDVLTLDNIGYTYFLQGDARAEELLISAFETRNFMNYPSILTSLLHLGEFYHKKDQQLALKYYEEAFRLSQERKDLQKQLETLTALIDLSENKSYRELHKTLEDEISEEKKELQYRFAKIKYKIEAQELEYKGLKNAFNNQQYQLAKKENQIRTFSILGISLIFLLTLGFLFFRQEQQNQKQQVQIKMLRARAEEKDRIAIYLHDDVANDLLMGLQESNALNLKLDNKEFENIIDQFDVVYHKVRGIAQNNSQAFGKNIPFEKRITLLYRQISFYNNLDVQIKGLDSIDWNAFLPEIRITLFNIIREALLNSLKHSKANKLGVVFSNLNNEKIEVLLWDNGLWEKETETEGLGIAHMKKLTEEMNGSFHLFFPAQGGTQLKIKLSIK